MKNKPWDKCKVTGCNNYVIGCIPMPLPGGKVKRFLERNPNLRFCKTHSPAFAKAESQKMKKAKAEAPICRGNHIKGVLIACTRRIGSGRLKKRPAGESCPASILGNIDTGKAEPTNKRRRCLVRRHFNPDYKENDAAKEVKRLEDRDKRLTAFLHRNLRKKNAK